MLEPLVDQQPHRVGRARQEVDDPKSLNPIELIFGRLDVNIHIPVGLKQIASYWIAMRFN